MPLGLFRTVDGKRNSYKQIASFFLCCEHKTLLGGSGDLVTRHYCHKYIYKYHNPKFDNPHLLSPPTLQAQTLSGASKLQHANPTSV